MEDYKNKYDDVQLERMLRENTEKRRANSTAGRTGKSNRQSNGKHKVLSDR